MAVYGYTRVSTDEQASEGESLGAQKRTIEGYAMMLGLTAAETFVERGVSGSTPFAERPEGTKLLAALEPGDVVITPKLDRMFRSARDALDVLDKLKAPGHQPAHDRPRRRRHRQRRVEAGVHHPERRGRGRARPHPRAHPRREAGPARPRALPRRNDAVRLPAGRGRRARSRTRTSRPAIKRMRKLRRSGKSLRAIAADMQNRGFAVSHMSVKKIAGT